MFVRAARNAASTASIALALAVALAGCGGSPEPLPTIDLSGGPSFPLPAHVESADLASGALSFQQIFDAGDALFHTTYTDAAGVGALRLPDGTPTLRFGDAPPGHGLGTAISSSSCGRCHVGTASGPAQANVAGDPGDDGLPPFRLRSTTSLFGNGILQLLAQEITEDLQAIRDQVSDAARAQPGTAIERPLTSKGIDYGVIAATATADGDVALDVSRLQGVDPDLVVRPLGWKGHVTTIRSNTMGAAIALMGLQAEELVWRMQEGGAPADPDGDGVERELSVGDITALVIYGAAQETPQSVERLAELGLIAQPDAGDLARVEAGRALFGRIGCASCHLPELRLANTVFSEPTRRGNGHYLDTFLTGRDPGYDPDRPVRFDILTDAQQPRAEALPDGGAIIRLYGDLKRHRMGRQLADPGGPQPSVTAVSEPLSFDGRLVLIDPDVYLTPELWGVGNTGPWMHDGRAAGLREAVLWHGEDAPPAPGEPGRSEAQEARDAFTALAPADQEAVLTFLRSLRTFSPGRP